MPSMGSAWDFRGLCEYETKDFGAAREHLEQGQSLGATDDPEVGHTAAYHLALLRIRGGEFDAAGELLNNTFSESESPEQIKVALGLAVLRVPLLPEEVDPTQESLLMAVGEAARADEKTQLEQLSKLVESHPTLPYLHYAYANALASANHLEEAINEYKLEAKVSPASELPWIAISSLELKATHPEAARQDAETAVHLASQSKSAHIALADALQAAGDTQGAARERALAKSLSAEAPRTEERVAALFRSRQPSAEGTSSWKEAMVDFSNARYEEAVALLTPWVQAHPNDGTAWAVLGLSEFRLKDYENSLVHLQRGGAFGFGGSPESVQLAHYTLGILLNHAGQFDRGMAILVSAQGAESQRVELAMGMSLLRIAKFPEEIDPSLRQLVQTAGATAELLHTSLYDQAFANFDALLKQAPTLAFLHYAYGTALIAMSRYDEAEVQMREEARISPKSELPYVRLASIAIRQHRAADASRAAEQALTLAPQSGEAHYLLGRARLESGDLQDAISELETASKMAPNSPEIHFNLAKAYTRAQLPQKAEQERAVFVRLNAEAEQQKAKGGTQSYEGPR